MLEFTLNSQPFAMDRSKSVILNWRNPACNFSEFPGDIGMGIDIPVNDINRALLGNPERFERYASENDREFSRFEIRYGGVLLLGGTLIIKTATHESYSGWLRSDIGNIGKEHREKYIYDSISFLEEKSFENKADYDPLTDDYGCPKIFNPDFFKEKGEKTEITKQMPNPNYFPFDDDNYWTKKDEENIDKKEEAEDFFLAFFRSAAWFVNAQNEDGTIKTPLSETYADAKTIATELEVCVVSPMLFLNYILRHIMKDSGFYLDNNFLASDADLKKLILYNNFDITKISYFVESYMIWEYQDWYDAEFTRAIGNPVDVIRRDVTGTFLYKQLVPQIRLKDFLLSIQNLLNVCIFFRPGRKIVDIIDREGILTGTAINIEQYLTGFWEIGEKKDSTLKFTFSHDKSDMQFTEGWEDIDDLRDNEKEPVDTWEDLEAIADPQMDEIRYVKSLNLYVQYKLWLLEAEDPVTGNSMQEKYLGWKHLTMGFQNGYYNYGKEEEEEVPTKFSTIKGEQTAVTYQKGNIHSEMFAWENFTPRLMFYLGNNEARYETDNIALDWEKEETGLLATRWRNWARFWATRQPVTCEAHFPLNMIAYVLNNITSKFRTREGEFIIEEMETEFGINQIGVTKIKGYKINYAPNIYQLTDVWRLGDRIYTDEGIVSDLINPFR